MKKCFTLLFFVALLGNATAMTYYVDWTATGGATGLTWEGAFTGLQSALAVAEAGDTILVAQGTYKPDVSNGDPAATFLIDVDLVLLGGFKSGGMDYDPAVYVTILSGDLNGNDVTGDFTANRNDNAKQVIRISYGVTAWIEGFSIQNAHADLGTAYQQDRGGGIYCKTNVNLTIKECRFLQNYSIWFGGGIFCKSPENLTVLDCLFEGNTAFSHSGGGIYLECSGEHNSSVIKGCAFIENFCKFDGGGIHITSTANSVNPSFLVDSCTFLKNSADTGGGLRGLFYGDQTRATVTHCNFLEDTSFLDDAGIGFRSFGKDIEIQVKHCSFSNNISFDEDVAGFGAAQNATGMVTLDDCLFENNQSAIAGALEFGSGGGGGGADMEYQLLNSTFRNNEAFEGGAVLFYMYPNAKASYLVDKCIFESNIATGMGGAVSLNATSSDFSAIFRNSIFSQNQSPDGGAINHFQYFSGMPFPIGASCVFENCLIVGNTSDNPAISIDSLPNLTFINCTIADNIGGGIELSNQSELTIQNTILCSPSGFPEYVPLTSDVSVISNGGNLIKDNSLATGNPNDLENQSPIFNKIGDYCAFYQLDTLSPGYNGGVEWADATEQDACGNERIWGGQIDVGAVEWTPAISSVSEEKINQLGLSPNPVTDLLNIEWPEPLTKATEIQIYSLQGQLVLNLAWTKAHSIDVRTLPSGIYLLKVMADGKYYNARFAKI